MRVTTQGILFISAYTPLLAIIILRYYKTHLIESLIVLIFIIIANGFLFGFLWGIVKHRSVRTFKVKSSINKTSDTLNYLIPYIISFLGLKLTQWNDLLSLLIILGIVFVIYVHSNLILMNPLINAFGYKFYSVEIGRGDNIIVITQKDLRVDNTITTKRISKGLYMM